MPQEQKRQPILGPQGALHFSTSTQAGAPLATDSDWRKEIRKKLDRHQLSKEGQPDPQSSRASQLKSRARHKLDRQKPLQQQPSRELQDGPDELPKLFDYRLKKGEASPDPRIVTFRQKPEELGKPVIRKPTKSRKTEPPDSRQRPLELVDIPQVFSSATHEPSVPHVAAPPPSLLAEDVPDEREVLFSRTLAGLLDLMLALLMGALFGFISATSMSADLTTPAVIEVAGVCALAFWLLNNSFFLFVAHQTPGMMVTDLKLVGERKVELGLGRIIWRILLQILSTVSLVGLAWAIFDEQHRCWHDRISHSLVVSALSLEPARGE